MQTSCHEAQPDVCSDNAIRQSMKNNIGKVMPSVSKQETTQASLHSQSFKFLSDAAYLIIGVCGGISQSLGTWVVRHSATNIVLLSHSTGQAEENSCVVVNTMEAGCRIKTINCDISDSPDPAAALMEYRQERLPLFGGTFQAVLMVQVLYSCCFKCLNQELP